MMIKQEIKLIGVDLDGTLLNDDKTLCPGAAETIRRACKKGIPIVPITGRPLCGIPKCIREIGEIEYLICSNGAQIIDAKTEKSLFSFSIPNEKSRALTQALKALNCIFEPFADGVGYTSQKIYDGYLLAFGGTPLEEYITSSRKIVETLDTLFDDGVKEADEFFVNCADRAVREELIKITARLGGLQYCNLADRFIEITRKGCDKGEALEAICRYLGIHIKNTMAFGDGENDLLFLEKAGVAVAMENAFESVKEKADIIAKSNNDNGVCEIINQLLSVML